MKLIWKAVIDPMNFAGQGGCLSAPKGARFLSAHGQDNKVSVWFECDPKAKRQPYRFHAVETGSPPPRAGRFLGTALMFGGDYVLHIYGPTGEAP